MRTRIRPREIEGWRTEQKSPPSEEGGYRIRDADYATGVC
jgi:hypothetical protein